ncbi:MAG: Asparagine synthase (Glutamine-hydrolyzing) [Acidobacteria bacterium]|nr:Asparagine synthase (Glutamine-hydrolyzing) [Acidobacteriota bacterium]
MTRSLAHRGPDGEGTFVAGHVGLGHRRLSIIDIDGGAQPMVSDESGVAVTFNGEIFNYRELTTELVARGHTFKTRSDTETLIHLYEEYGIAMVQRLRGMFAFALLDQQQRTVYLVRDRFGIKPLYYHQNSSGALHFASEIAPLIRAGYSVDVNQQAIPRFLQTRFPYGDETLFRGVHRVPEGAYIQWSEDRVRQHRYYTMPLNVAQDGGRNFEAEFEAGFADAVKTWMIADVPVGAYLSGGVDSSTLVSEMARVSSHAIRSFSIHFTEGYSEAAVAEQTAKELGCEHQTVMCGVDELLELPRIVRVLEEPVGDTIVVAQYVLARAAARAGLKTVITGDGADEVLGGYQHLRAIASMTTWSERLPGWLFATAGASIAKRLPLPLIEALADLPLDVARDARERLVKVLGMLPKRDMRALYDELLALYSRDELNDVYTDGFHAQISGCADDSFAGVPAGATVLGRVLSLQFRHWLPELINLKQDRVSMAHGLENRVPFLDHQFVELLSTFPDRLKMDGRRSKVALRRLAATRLRHTVAGATKMPFHMPLQHYLSDPRVWQLVEDNLDDVRVRRRDIVKPDYVRRLKAMARAGDYMVAKKLFALVILELWYRTFVDGERL